ncbi:MAG: long-chain-fatty-acid--CoA ligase [Quisquiliibacterium sp.]
MNDSMLIQSRRIGREHASALAFVTPARSWTFGDIESLSNRLAQGMLASGLGKGDRVACLTKRTAECVAVALAAQKIGAVCMPINWRLAPPETKYIVDNGQARILLVDPEFVSICGQVEFPSVQVRLVSGDPIDGLQSLEQWAASHPDLDPDHQPDPDDTALQLYSSGTTGLPKGVELTYRSLGAAFQGPVPEAIGYRGEGSVMLNALPTFHIAGIGIGLMTYAYGGKSVLFPDFNPPQVLDSIAQHGVTHSFLVPAMIQFLLQVPGAAQRDYSSLQYISYGASPITERVLVDAMKTFGCKFVQVYGLTETSGAITALAAEDHVTDGPKAVLLRSAGKPIRGVELRAVDSATGQDVAEGEVGEIWIRTEQNMKGYWRNPQATQDAFVDHSPGRMGWFRSGDAGYLRDGYLFLHDRIKDMIVSGGENIYPAEVENVLMQHPAVADGAVFGVPDERWGEAVKACVVPKPGSEASAQGIIEWMRERLAHFKCPSSVDFVEAIPRNPSGKILKRILREPYWEGKERQIN